MEKQKRRPRSSKSDYSEYWRKAESPCSSGGHRLRSSSAAVKTPNDDNNRGSVPSQSRHVHDEKPSPGVVVNDNDRGATKDSKSRRQVAEEEEEESRDEASAAHSTGNVGRGGGVGGGEEEAGSRDRAGSRGGGRRHGVRPYFEPMRRAYWMDEYKMEDDYYMHSLAKIYDVTPMKRQKERQYWNILQHLGGCRLQQWNGYERYLSRPRTTEHRLRVNRSESSQRNQRSRSTMTSSASASAADGKRTKPTNEEEENRRRKMTSSAAETPQQQQQRSPRNRTRQSRENEDKDNDRDRDGHEEDKEPDSERSQADKD